MSRRGLLAATALLLALAGGPAAADCSQIDGDVKAALAAGAVGAATVKRPIGDSRTFDLSLVSDRSDYKIGDQVVFTVTSEQDCFLTLINVDQKGSATVLFPNKFDKDNGIKAGTDLNFPSETAGFQFSFADPGTETVIAVCSLTDKPVDDIKFPADHAPSPSSGGGLA